MKSKIIAVAKELLARNELALASEALDLVNFCEKCKSKKNPNQTAEPIPETESQTAIEPLMGRKASVLYDKLVDFDPTFGDLKSKETLPATKFDSLSSLDNRWQVDIQSNGAVIIHAEDEITPRWRWEGQTQPKQVYYNVRDPQEAPEGVEAEAEIRLIPTLSSLDLRWAIRIQGEEQPFEKETIAWDELDSLSDVVAEVQQEFERKCRNLAEPEAPEPSYDYE